tara:strand:- start:346 stop:1068 length:723 start_codon:yes stop_codon:yes gene_type:complete
MDIEHNNSYPDGIPHVSVVISTFNKAGLLEATLSSIRENITNIPYEIVVVDDGSIDNTIDICKRYGCIYVWLDSPSYRNPSVPRNVGARTARGKILIMQSDDVLHKKVDTIDKLSDIQRGEVKFATVYNVDDARNHLQLYIGKDNNRPLFFLGSMHKDDFWAIGGNDEDFISPGYEDEFLGELIKKNYQIEYCDDVTGYHQNHARPSNLSKLVEPSRLLFQEKMKELENECLLVRKNISS